jgi:Flp pilus assembly pilin Flp
MRNLILNAMAWGQTRRTRDVLKGREEGQTVIEYALVVAGISIVLIALLVTFGNSIISKAQSKVNAVAFLN